MLLDELLLGLASEVVGLPHEGVDLLFGRCLFFFSHYYILYRT